MDINTITISGRLTRTAEMWGEDGNKIAHFDVAVNRGYKDKQTTYFIPCSLFKADNVGKFLLKGATVVVSGSLEYSDSKDGKRYWSIAVKEMSIVKYADLVVDEGTAEEAPRPNRRSANKVAETSDQEEISDMDIPF